MKDGMHRIDIIFTGERALSRGHFVENDSEGKDIAAMIDELAEYLLGRHVIGGAHHRAGTRQDLHDRFFGAVGFGRFVGASDKLFSMKQELAC